LIYLAAIAAANLLVSRFGPTVAVLNAVLFIGFDLSTRDRLHERWSGAALWPRMLALIVAGGLLSLLLGGSGRVALASCLAFILAGITDTIVYGLLHRHPWHRRVNGSNLASAAVDSLCFPLFAFGWPVLWNIVLGQFVAKVAGGAIWALILRCASHSPRSSQ
jgi:uncharacterized PurR-regulated membrane protein YhhQ (DUF165 family)